MNLRKNLENTLSSLLTHYGDSLTLFGEMVEVSHRQTPRKDCDAKAPRQYSTISGFRLGIALPNDRAAASQGCEAVVSVYPISAAERRPKGWVGATPSRQLPPSSAADMGFLSLALAAVPLSFLRHPDTHPFAAARASLTRRT